MEQFLLNHAVLSITIGVVLTVSGYRLGIKAVRRFDYSPKFLFCIGALIVISLAVVIAATFFVESIVLCLAGIGISSFVLGAILA